LTFSPDEEHPYPLAQEISGAHKLGIHHICASLDGKTLASAGFGGEVRIWSITEDGPWQAKGRIVGAIDAQILGWNAAV